MTEIRAIEVLKNPKVEFNGQITQIATLLRSMAKGADALEKQIPNKLKEYGICPVCNYYFGMDKVNYCPNCGQRLDIKYKESEE